MRKCQRCKVEKPLSGFSFKSAKQCILCVLDNSPKAKKKRASKRREEERKRKRKERMRRAAKRVKTMRYRLRTLRLLLKQDIKERYDYNVFNPIRRELTLVAVARIREIRDYEARIREIYRRGYLKDAKTKPKTKHWDYVRELKW